VVFEAGYLSMGLPGGGEETYVVLTPPGPVDNDFVKVARKIDAVVVLDCSGSMAGRRMDAANYAMKRLYACSQIESLTVIGFGTRVAPKQVFRKCNEKELQSFQANLGSTNFIPPLLDLETSLRCRDAVEHDKSNITATLAIFISDGQCHDNPLETIKNLTDILRRIDCPLMSVAITTDVRPDAMVALADAHGDLPLLVVHDHDSVDTLAEQLLELLPLGSHEKARISFLREDNCQLVTHSDVKFARDGSVVEFLAPHGVPFKDLLMTVALINEDGSPEAVDVRLRRLSAEEPAAVENIEHYSALHLAGYGRALLFLANKIVGVFIKGDLPREQAEQRIMSLREAFVSEIGAVGTDVDNEKARVRVRGMGGGAVTREHRARLVAMFRARRAAATEVQHDFNKILETIGRNDVRAALEAYSQQTLKGKYNKRLGQIARNNASRSPQKVNDEAAIKTLRSYEDHGDLNREMAPCLLWLCNPYEAIDGFDGTDQGDWVGRAVYVVPGRVAALNCWRMEKVIVRPLNITRSLVSQIKVNEADGQRRAMVSGTGYPEFNACLPMISPDEHVGAVRLAIHCMRRSTEAQAALADIVCGSQELYDGAMLNAVYVTAVLSSLAHASSEADFDGTLRALLTTFDIVRHNGTEGSTPYWSDVFGQLAGPDATAFVACKEMDKLPDAARAFLPIVCTDAAYAAPESTVQAICAMLLVRTALDQTSEKLGLYEALGIDEKAFLASCRKRAADASAEELDLAIQDPAAAAVAVVENIRPVGVGYRLHLSKVTNIYRLHLALRRLVGEGGAAGLLDGVMDGSLPVSSLLAVLRDIASAATPGKPEACLAQVLGIDNGTSVLSDLLVACCHGQVPGASDLPRHDGKYVSACFESLQRCGGATAQGLHALAREVRERAFAATFQEAIKKVHFDRHKLEIVQTFARRAEAFLREHPWEAHRHEMPALTLGFSTHERTFRNRDELWAALQDGWYHSDDLEELHVLTRETVKEFDFDAWKASHRHFLPGFHIYSGKNLSLSRGIFADYRSRMQQDMEDHYAGRKNPIYKREYTHKMRAWLEPYARHIFQESHIVMALRHIASDGGTEEALAHTVWMQFPELDSLPPDRKAARRRHFVILAREALEQAGKA